MIDADLYISLSFALTFGVPLWLACRELLALKADRRRPDGGELREVPAPAPLGDDDLPPLPPSLMPQLDHRPAPQPKVLEPA